LVAPAFVHYSSPVVSLTCTVSTLLSSKSKIQTLQLLSLHVAFYSTIQECDATGA